MKNLACLFLFLFLSTFLIAQSTPEKVLVDAGNFVVINQEGRTRVFNSYDTENVDRIVLRKEIVQSIVINDYSKKFSPNRRLRKLQEKLDETSSDTGFLVIISTSENKGYRYANGQGSAAAANVNKTYSVFFSSLSEAKSFVDELVILCN